MRFTGKYVVTGSSDQLVKVWLYDEGVPTHVGVGHAGVVTNVKISPDGRLVVSTSADGGVFLWRFPHDDRVTSPAPPPTPTPRTPPLSLASSSRGVGGGGGDAKSRQQQTDSSRRLSQKKTMPARQENISALSSRASKNGDASCASDAGGVPAPPAGATDGSVKCLCPRGTTCHCADGGSGGSRKS